jgi:hypothetical protein
MSDANEENVEGSKCSESGSSVVRQVVGEPDCEFPHIVRVNGKLHCNNCGDWEYLREWMPFVNRHSGCEPV